jgi:hypothetical protein
VRDDIGVQAKEQSTQYRGLASVWMPIVTVADEVPSDKSEWCEPILEEDIEECIVRGVDHTLMWEVGIDGRRATIHEEPQHAVRTVSRDQTERISDEFCPDLTHEHPSTREREELVWREDRVSDSESHYYNNDRQNRRYFFVYILEVSGEKPCEEHIYPIHSHNRHADIAACRDECRCDEEHEDRSLG